MMSARTIVALVAFLAVSSRLLASAAFVASDSFDGTLTNGYFGYGIDVDGDFAIAGSPAASTSDFASIFERVNGEWQLVKNLTSPNPQSNGFFGHSVTISRTGFAAVGAYGETVQQPRDGRVYNYKRQANGKSIDESGVALVFF